MNNRVVTSMLHRWVLRAITRGVEPELIGLDPEISLQFLTNWLSTVDSEKDKDIGKHILAANFDVGEYFLFCGDFSSAENFLKKTQQIIEGPCEYSKYALSFLFSSPAHFEQV